MTKLALPVVAAVAAFSAWADSPATFAPSAFLGLARNIRGNVPYERFFQAYCSLRQLNLSSKRLPVDKTRLRESMGLDSSGGAAEGRLLASMKALGLIVITADGRLVLSKNAPSCGEQPMIDHIPRFSMLAPSNLRETGQFSGLNATRGVLIVSLGRSASTLVGEIFNRRQGALYFFEPCRTIGADFYQSCTDLLLRLFSCSFNLDDTKRLFADRSAAVQSNVLRSLINQVKEGHHSADDLHGRFLYTCRTASIIVSKEVRFLNIPESEGAVSLKLSTALKEGKFHIINLVRDPRGILDSRLRVPGFCNHGDAALCGEEICATYRDMLSWTDRIRGMAEEGGPLTSPTIFRLHYEVLAAEPLETMHKIYSFAGIQEDESDPRTERWLWRTTHEKSGIGQLEPYGFRRDANASAAHWQEGGLSSDQISVISSQCSEVLQRAGYSH